MSPRSTPLSRRGFLSLTGAGALAVALPGCGDLGGSTGELLTSAARLTRPYTVPLPVPRVLVPDAAGTIEVTQRVADLELLPGLRTRVLGYDGTFPGPTLETRSGRPVVVRHRNELPVPTAVHLHGGHSAPEHDGWPLDLVLPAGGRAEDWAPHGHGGGGRAMPLGNVSDGVRDYRYEMDQRAATLWYHDHRMDFTGPAVWHGLAGMHLVRDAEEDALPLPGGDHELPLVVCDRAFAEDGSFDYPSVDRSLRTTPGVTSAWHEGVLGDVVLVNGAPWPVHEVDAARYRLRLLNASNARRYQFAFSTTGGDLPFHQIGSDGGLLAAPVEHTSLTVAPGERFDLVVDLSRVPVGDEVTVVNRLASGGPGRVLRFRVVRPGRDDSHVPAVLSAVEPLEVPDDDPVVLHFRRGQAGSQRGWTINGGTFAPDVPVVEVPLGEVRRWRFVSDVHHPVHVHLDPFQVLRRGRGGPGPSDAGWKDTVDLAPGETVEVALRFTTHRGRYVAHCHNLEHEDMAMMAAVDVV